MDIEMMRNDIRQLDKSLGDLAKERNRLRSQIPSDRPIAFSGNRANIAGNEAGGEKEGALKAALPQPCSTLHGLGYVEPVKDFKQAQAAGSLLGVASLKIDVVQTPSETDRVLTFRSLGVEPELMVTLVNQSRMAALAWGLALAVGLAGVVMTRRPVRKKTVYVLIVAIVATLLPLMTAGIEVARVCNMLFYAACLLAPYYLAAGLVRWGVLLAVLHVHRQGCRRSRGVCAGAHGGSFSAPWAHAEPESAKPQAADGPYVIQVSSSRRPRSACPTMPSSSPYDPGRDIGHQRRRQAAGAL